MKTKAEIAQEIIDFNREHAGTGRFAYSDDPEVVAILDDHAFEQRERDRQRRQRVHNLRVMLVIVGSGDKSFGMRELIER